MSGEARWVIESSHGNATGLGNTARLEETVNEVGPSAIEVFLARGGKAPVDLLVAACGMERLERAAPQHIDEHAGSHYDASQHLSGLLDCCPDVNWAATAKTILSVLGATARFDDQPVELPGRLEGPPNPEGMIWASLEPSDEAIAYLAGLLAHYREPPGDVSSQSWALQLGVAYLIGWRGENEPCEPRPDAEHLRLGDLVFAGLCAGRVMTWNQEIVRRVFARREEAPVLGLDPTDAPHLAWWAADVLARDACPCSAERAELGKAPCRHSLRGWKNKPTQRAGAASLGMFLANCLTGTTSRPDGVAGHQIGSNALAAGLFLVAMRDGALTGKLHWQLACDPVPSPPDKGARGHRETARRGSYPHEGIVILAGTAAVYRCSKCKTIFERMTTEGRVSQETNLCRRCRNPGIYGGDQRRGSDDGTTENETAGEVVPVILKDMWIFASRMTRHTSMTVDVEVAHVEDQAPGEGHALTPREVLITQSWRLSVFFACGCTVSTKKNAKKKNGEGRIASGNEEPANTEPPEDGEEERVPLWWEVPSTALLATTRATAIAALANGLPTHATLTGMDSCPAVDNPQEHVPGARVRINCRLCLETTSVWELLGADGPTQAALVCANSHPLVDRCPDCGMRLGEHQALGGDDPQLLLELAGADLQWLRGQACERGGIHRLAADLAADLAKAIEGDRTVRTTEMLARAGRALFALGRGDDNDREIIQRLMGELGNLGEKGQNVIEMLADALRSPEDGAIATEEQAEACPSCGGKPALARALGAWWLAKKQSRGGHFAWRPAWIATEPEPSPMAGPRRPGLC